LATLTNAEAKRFFLTYYSGQKLTKSSDFDFAPMFVLFLNFVENTTGIKIAENNENQKEF
jgi:hypothetical protein